MTDKLLHLYRLFLPARRACLQVALVAATLTAASPVLAIDDAFERQPGNARSGFEPVSDARYQKECGGCHFVYLPGLLPARSWQSLMERLDRHFGENVDLPAETRAAIRTYLTERAADRSDWMGSKVLMERVPAQSTPSRIQTMPRLATSHRVIREVIGRNFSVKVRTLVNCDACHQMAAEGDFSWHELRVEGLTASTMGRATGFKSR